MTQDIFLHRMTIKNVERGDQRHLEMTESAIPDGAFVFEAIASNRNIDAYYTHMDESTLRNFADDSKTGVSFLDSHDSRKLGIGYTFNGLFDGERTLTGIYTSPGIRFGGNHSFESTDDFIAAVKARLVRDVSVGFYGGNTVCDICQLNVWGRTECPHFPGSQYGIDNELVTATALIKDARLAELSAVFDGATPGAMITKFERGLTEGWITRDLINSLEHRYRVQLPDEQKRKIFTFSSGEKPMDGKQDNPTDAPELNGAERQLLRQAKRAADSLAALDIVPNETAIDAAVELAIDQLDKMPALERENETLIVDLGKATEEIARLQPLADDGKAYRENLIADALAEGIRANGSDDFAEETYRGILEKAGIETIKQMRADWKRLGDARFQGGSQVQNENEPPATNERASSVPASAYAV